MRAFVHAAALTGLLCLGHPARADAPPMPPAASSDTCSVKRTACAHVDRRAGITTVRRAGGAVLWSMRDTPQRLSISDDGRSVVEEYAGGQLLDPGVGPDTTMLTILDRGRVVGKVPLKDLILRPDALPRTVSHRQWAHAFGFDGDGGYIVDTVENRVIHIDVVSGRTMMEAFSGDANPWYCRYEKRAPGKACERAH